MNKQRLAVQALILASVLILWGASVQAAIDGITGTTFNITAKSGHISTADGGSYLIWGFANGSGVAQYPGPTLILTQGATVTINLSNALNFPVSMVFPGMTNVTAVGGSKGLLTQEATIGNSVTYTFTADRPGTYMYHSGTNPDLQVEMGLFGAIIVRPSDYDPCNPSTWSAYGGGSTSSTGYDREYLFLLSEMDPVIHNQVEFTPSKQVDTTKWWPTYWFINGRTAPDTMDFANVPWLPNQPYNVAPAMHPGDRVLLRMIGAGRDLHPLHTHGNHVTVIARDGRPLESVPGSGNVDIPERAFTVTVVPGGTADGIFVWTGHNLGWDFYGHGWDIVNGVSLYADRAACLLANPISPTPTTGNYVPGECPGDVDGPACDHCKGFPVRMPPIQDIVAGAFFSGSPFLGAGGVQKPGEGGFNPNSGFFFMWHSHNENEIVNNNIFPGGLMTMAVVEHPNVTLPTEITAVCP